ncbi:hypothetical protein Pint_07358 [Pistacia integerrima]|uniref:Uncharacterized protein n=1 Tax=Pistacia integerrima TaxID=434235 RepID=A0ACC0XXP7_9ROSI|nr:hypothetical protein Pint_07358 [Pistacia integerrima]
MDNGSSLLHRDVKYILDILPNLISIGRLDDEGYCNTSSNGCGLRQEAFYFIYITSKTFRRHY